MAWETRGRKRYYYEKRREGARILTRYRGGEALGGPHLALAGISRATRGFRRRTAQAILDREVALDRRLSALAETVHALFRVLMVLEGYRSHKGEWRRSRDAQETP